MVTVKLFAALSDWAGTREVQIPYRAEINCIDLWTEIKRRYPKVAPVHPLFAIDAEYVSGETVLKDNDSVMIFPPVSGG